MIWNINKLDNLFLLLKIAFNPFVHCNLLGGDNTDLPSDSNISKMLRVSIAFNCFLMVCTLLDFGLVVDTSRYWCLKFWELLTSQKLSFSIFAVLKGLMYCILTFASASFSTQLQPLFIFLQFEASSHKIILEVSDEVLLSQTKLNNVNKSFVDDKILKFGLLN